MRLSVSKKLWALELDCGVWSRARKCGDASGPLTVCPKSLQSQCGSVGPHCHWYRTVLATAVGGLVFFL